MQPKKVKPGDELYVGTSLYIDRGEDDVCGGIATVESVEPYPPNDPNTKTYFVYFVGLPTGINLTYILENQDEWRNRYGDHIAHHCPDIPGHVCPNPMRRTRDSILNIVGKEK